MKKNTANHDLLSDEPLLEKIIFAGVTAFEKLRLNMGVASCDEFYSDEIKIKRSQVVRNDELISVNPEVYQDLKRFERQLIN